MNSNSGENWKEPSTPIDASINGDSNEETLNVNKISWQQQKINGV